MARAMAAALTVLLFSAGHASAQDGGALGDKSDGDTRQCEGGEDNEAGES